MSYLMLPRSHRYSKGRVVKMAASTTAVMFYGRVQWLSSPFTSSVWRIKVLGRDEGVSSRTSADMFLGKWTLMHRIEVCLTSGNHDNYAYSPYSGSSPTFLSTPFLAFVPTSIARPLVHDHSFHSQGIEWGHGQQDPYTLSITCHSFHASVSAALYSNVFIIVPVLPIKHLRVWRLGKCFLSEPTLEGSIKPKHKV